MTNQQERAEKKVVSQKFIELTCTSKKLSGQGCTSCPFRGTSNCFQRPEHHPAMVLLETT